MKILAVIFYTYEIKKIVKHLTKTNKALPEADDSDRMYERILLDQWDLSSSGDSLTGLPPVKIKPYINFMYSGNSGRSYYCEIEAVWSNED